MTESTPQSARSAFAKVLLASGLTVVLAEAAAFCFYGTSVYDEGGYLYEGWLAVRHGWLPFRDFYTKLPPLIYYLYGVGQALFGPGLLAGRIEAVLLTLVALALSAALARRLVGRWGAVLVVWLFALSPAAINAYFHAHSQAPTGVFVVLAFYFCLWRRPERWALCLGGLASAGFLLCRHDLLPLAAALWVYLLWWGEGPWQGRLAAVACGVLGFVAVVLPFAVVAPLNVLYALTAGAVNPLGHFPSTYGMSAPATPFTIVWHTMVFLRYYAACLLLLVPAAAWLVARRDEPLLPGQGTLPSAGNTAASRRERLVRAFWLLLSASAVNWVGRLLAAVVLGQNIPYVLDLYIYFPVATAAAVGFIGLAREVRSLSLAGHPVRTMMGAFAVAALVLAPLFTGPCPLFMFSRARPTTLEQVWRGGAFLRQHTRPDEMIFTLDDPHLFLEAGRLMFPPLTHELFSFRESGDTAALKRLHYFNKAMIADWLSGKAPVVVMSEQRDRWMVGSGRYPRGQELHDFIAGLLQANYELVAVEEGTYDGPTRLYRWRGQAPRAAHEKGGK